MPYIDQDDREDIEEVLAEGGRMVIEKPGHLNYIVTRFVKDFLYYEPNYTNINAAVGALECAKLELYRRIAAPYEDTKMKENGDVY